MDLSSGINEKNWSKDRLLTLRIADNKAPLNSTGLVDKRLFSGDNKLHAIADLQTGLWSFRYERGGLPPALLDHKFTSFTSLFKYAKEYFIKRNIEITEVTNA